MSTFPVKLMRGAVVCVNLSRDKYSIVIFSSEFCSFALNGSCRATTRFASFGICFAKIAYPEKVAGFVYSKIRRGISNARRAAKAWRHFIAA